MRLIVMFGLALLLAGCATTNSSNVDAPVSIPALPTSLAAPCMPPATLPIADTNQQDTERLWATDRTSLKICGERQAGVVKSYNAVRDDLAGAAKAGR